MIDARRMEVYAALYDRALKPVRPIAADIVDEHSYAEYLEKHPVYFFGDGADKCKEKLTHPNAHFIDHIHPLASMMFPLAEKAIAENDFQDVAYFEPFYIDHIHPLASMMFPLAEKAIAENDFQDVAYFEPFYLKEFVASKPKDLRQETMWF